jgi:hypothetical protein
MIKVARSSQNAPFGASLIIDQHFDHWECLAARGHPGAGCDWEPNSPMLPPDVQG